MLQQAPVLGTQALFGDRRFLLLLLLFVYVLFCLFVFIIRQTTALLFTVVFIIETTSDQLTVIMRLVFTRVDKKGK